MTSQRIRERFDRRTSEGRTTLVAFVTVGYPTVEESFECARAALEAGADVLELGVPFSDPTADGPIIARASYEAIRSGGSLRVALNVAERLRETHDEPIVLFSYYNPILAFGDDRLPGELSRIGIDGLLVVDLPPDEGSGLRSAAREADVAFIPLLAPTSGPERERELVRGASGFIYYVSVTGVTGSGVAPLEEAGRHAAQLQEQCGLPVAVGFGIDGPEKARRAAAAGARGVVVGTAIVRAIGEAEEGKRPSAVSRLVSELRAGLDAPTSTPT